MLLSILLALAGQARGDEILYQYEGNVLPYDPGAGWVIADPCEGPACSESIVSGEFRLTWESGDVANYHYWIAQPPTPSPEPPFWVEWRFRSDSPKPSTHSGCDGRVRVNYWRIGDIVYLHGDAAVSFEGGDFVTGLELDTLHTYRFETGDGLNYSFSVDGRVFHEDSGQSPQAQENPFLQFGGDGSCNFGMNNAWDYIRYGRVSEGEEITTASPRAGFLDPANFSELDRFSITLDQPGYVYLENIDVTVSAGEIPVVTKTWRKSGQGANQLEIVLDRPLTVGETTTFTFAGLDPDHDTVSYTLIAAIPAMSPLTAIAGAVALVIVGAIILKRRSTGTNSDRQTETPCHT